MALYPYASSSKTNAPKPVGITEFEILKASHKFLREEDEQPSTWDEKLAGKYYSNLYREFAVCDLKHYKSGNFALRWRTEDEVLSGSGETTCGNTRCEHHFAPRFREDEEGSKVPLTTLELPFAYVEHGASKSALVKVVLCRRCVKKLMWKRSMEKEKARASALPPDSLEDASAVGRIKVESEEEGNGLEAHRRKKRSREDVDEKEKSSRRRRRSRSKSPHRTRGENKQSKRTNSPRPS
ncbi:folate-sensitive fragile site protein Fra10Ac1-domain-containing protein [Pholiota molesta]|nr:folate-sensitive fragile site protein Fra10Ac1-domain-containing protein [Pholiota molesta]